MLSTAKRGTKGREGVTYGLLGLLRNDEEGNLINCEADVLTDLHLEQG